MITLLRTAPVGSPGVVPEAASSAGVAMQEARLFSVKNNFAVFQSDLKTRSYVNTARLFLAYAGVGSLDKSNVRELALFENVHRAVLELVVVPAIVSGAPLSQGVQRAVSMMLAYPVGAMGVCLALENLSGFDGETGAQRLLGGLAVLHRETAGLTLDKEVLSAIGAVFAMGPVIDEARAVLDRPGGYQDTELDACVDYLAQTSPLTLLDWLTAHVSEFARYDNDARLALRAINNIPSVDAALIRSKLSAFVSRCGDLQSSVSEIERARLQHLSDAVSARLV